MQKNVMIVGCGNIGLRHAQGLSKSKFKINLYLVDKLQKNINFFIKSLKPEKNLNIVSQSREIKKIRKKINLLILSTDSKKRYDLLKKNLKLNSIENIILEKFVFLKKDNFKDILILKKKIWVNTPMRTYKSYKNLKKKLFNKNINMEVFGYKWNMASNIIHYFDLFQYLSGFKKIVSEKVNINKKILNSKRAGYKEIAGKIKFFTNNKNFISFKDLKSKKTNGVKVRIFNKKQNFLIDERAQTCIYNNKKRKAFEIPFQSNMTNYIADKIFLKKTCDLTTLKQSSYLHIMIINILKKYTHYKKNNFPVS